MFHYNAYGFNIITVMIKKQKNISRREYILWVVVLVLVISQAWSVWSILRLQEGMRYNSDLSMRFSLKDVEERRYKYPIIDVTENKVYLPEAHIYLPLNEVSRDIRYDFKKGSAATPSILYFSVSSIVGRQSDAKYASCDRIVTLASASDSQISGSKIGAIQPTRDGLEDIYMHSDGPCWNEELYINLRSELVGVVKAAKSY